MPSTPSKPIALHRTGASNPFGKLTAQIPKLKIPEETHDILEREARLAHMTLSEFVRNLLMVRAHGVEVVAKVQESRLRVVAGLGAEGVGNG